MDTTSQRELFPELHKGEETGTKPPSLTRDASLQAALGTFERHMQDEGFSINTVKAFASDIRLLGRYLGIGTPIGEIGTKNLNDYLHWLTDERWSRYVDGKHGFDGYLRKKTMYLNWS